MFLELVQARPSLTTGFSQELPANYCWSVTFYKLDVLSVARPAASRNEGNTYLTEMKIFFLSSDNKWNILSSYLQLHISHYDNVFNL